MLSPPNPSLVLSTCPLDLGDQQVSADVNSAALTWHHASKKEVILFLQHRLTFCLSSRLPRMPLRQAEDTRPGEATHPISPSATQVTM